MIVFLNQQKVDYGVNYQSLVCDLLLYQSSQIKYQPIEVAKENLRSLCELFIEAFTQDKNFTKDKDQKKEIGNLMRRIGNLIKLEPNLGDNKKMTEVIYNFVLSLEGKGLLNGFGFANSFGDSLSGNSEKRSIRN